MESADILHYLLDVIQTDGLGSMARLASMTILNKLFDSDPRCQIKLKCLQSAITSSLLLALDTALSPRCDPADLVYVSVAMEIMWKLSKLPRDAIQPLITDNVFRRLLAFLDTDGDFFKFPHNTKAQIAKICENKQLIGKVKVISMASELLDYIHKHTKNSLKRLPSLPDTVYLCRMYDTESHDDLDITQCMIQGSLACPGTFPGDVITDLQNEWQDIIVTRVLDGAMFWAQVGEQVIKDVYNIQQFLNCDIALSTRISPRAGDHVVVMGDVMGTSCFLRAQILSEDCGSVDAFALDYGYMLTVPDIKVYCLPDKVKLSNCPQKISLCSIADIQPPYDEGLIINALAVLANLCKQSFTAGSLASQFGCISLIYHLLQTCQRSKVTTQVVTLLNNLACNSRLKTDITNGNFVMTLLDIISRLIGSRIISTDVQNDDDGVTAADDDDRLLLARCMICLTNILYRNTDTREQFYRHQGIDITVRLLKWVGKKNILYKMAVKLLKIFINQATVKSTDSSTVPRQPSKPYLSNPDSTTTQQTLVTRKDCPISRQVVSSENQPESHQLPCIRRRTVDTSDSECEDDTRVSHDLVFETNCYLKQSSVSSYNLGSTVRFCDDERHELRPNKKVTSIAASAIAQHVCGILNTSRGGHVYFGIDKDREVFGLELSRDEKDRFRLGMDQLMFNKISPVLLHSQFDLMAVPVIDPETEQILPNLYVIDITVKASKSVIYTMSDGACYYRFGSETTSITALDLRQLIIYEEESHYIEEIRQLQKQKHDLLKLLH